MEWKTQADGCILPVLQFAFTADNLYCKDARKKSLSINFWAGPKIKVEGGGNMKLRITEEVTPRKLVSMMQRYSRELDADVYLVAEWDGYYLVGGNEE